MIKGTAATAKRPCPRLSRCAAKERPGAHRHAKASKQTRIFIEFGLGSSFPGQQKAWNTSHDPLMRSWRTRCREQYECPRRKTTRAPTLLLLHRQKPPSFISKKVKPMRFKSECRQPRERLPETKVTILRRIRQRETKNIYDGARTFASGNDRAGKQILRCAQNDKEGKGTQNDKEGASGMTWMRIRNSRRRGNRTRRSGWAER